MLKEYNMANQTNTNSGGPLIIFTMITTIYYIIKYNLDDNPDEKGKSMNNVYFIIYLLILVISHFFINLNMSRKVCGTNQFETTIYATVGPWIIIFGFLYIALKTFPSWLMPFSNTFGYGLALLAGLNETVEKLFKSTENAKQDELPFLEKIYTDKSLIINEITLSNFDNFWSNMKGLFRKEVLDEEKLKDQSETVKTSLRKLVKMKELAAEYIWYIMSGVLISSMSYNFIITSSCKKSVQEMQDSFNKVEMKELAKNNKK